jgi:hypothetical protein
MVFTTFSIIPIVQYYINRIGDVMINVLASNIVYRGFVGGALKKIAPSGGRREKFWGILCEKSRFYVKKLFFSNFRGGARRVRPS